MFWFQWRLSQFVADVRAWLMYYIIHYTMPLKEALGTEGPDSLSVPDTSIQMCSHVSSDIGDMSSLVPCVTGGCYIVVAVETRYVWDPGNGNMLYMWEKFCLEARSVYTIWHIFVSLKKDPWHCINWRNMVHCSSQGRLWDIVFYVHTAVKFPEVNMRLLVIYPSDYPPWDMNESTHVLVPLGKAWELP